MSHPRVSIVVLNWNGIADTSDCIESLRAVAYPRCDIIVVDNDSEGDDVRLLRERFGEAIHIIENDRNYGFSGGCNIGIEYSLANLAPEYVLLLNNDTIVDPAFLDEMVELALTDERIGIVGPKILYFDEPRKIWFAGGNINYWLGRFWHRGIGKEDSTVFDEIRDVDFISGCCMLLSRRLLQTVGLLDDTFFFGTEDYDISIRAARSGFRLVYAPRSRIWHKVSRSTDMAGRSPSPTVAYYHARNHFILLEKHWSRVQYATATAYFVALLPLLFGLFLYYDRRWRTVERFTGGLLDYVRHKW